MRWLTFRRSQYPSLLTALTLLFVVINVFGVGGKGACGEDVPDLLSATPTAAVVVDGRKEWR